MLNRYKILIALAVLFSLTAVDTPNDQEVNNMVIIGGGVSGLSAAIYASRAELNPLVIEGKSSQLTKASLIENMPGVLPILGLDLSTNLHDQAEAHGTRFLKSSVERVDFSTRPFKIWTSNSEEIPVLANSIIVATGTRQGKLNCPGESKYQNKGVALCATCDGPLFKDKSIILIGGDYSALREAIILSKFTNKLKIINKGPKLKGPKSLLNPVLKNPNIEILNNTEAIEITGNEDYVIGVKILSKKDNQEDIIPADVIFIATNWIPETDLFKNYLELDPKKRIKVHNNTETSVPGVFAAGDATTKARHQVPIASAFGYMAGMDSEEYLLKNNLLPDPVHGECSTLRQSSG